MAAETISYRFRLRRRTAASWTALNEVLLGSEIGHESDTGKLKIGDGSTAWNDLDYILGGAAGQPFAVGAGTSDAITATFDPAPELTDGMQFGVRAAAANTTTAPTFNPNSLGAATITKLGGAVLAVGDIAGAGHELILRYRESPARYELLNPAPPLQSVTPGDGVSVDTTDPRNPVVSSTLGSIALSGRVADYASLPSTGLASGDAYYVESDGLMYIWDGAAFPAEGSGVSVGGGALVASATVTGSAVTSLTVSGLDLSTAKRYRLLLVAKNGVASVISLRMIFNGDTTATHYYRQLIFVSGTAISGSKANDSDFVGMDASGNIVSDGALIVDVDGYARCIFQTSREGPANLALEPGTIRWNSAANVTSLTITASVAGGLAVGSYIKVYSR